jgi:hypothetical protein
MHSTEQMTLDTIAVIGDEPFWTVASDTTADLSTPDLAAACYPEADALHSLPGHEAIVDRSQSAKLLGVGAPTTMTGTLAP